MSNLKNQLESFEEGTILDSNGKASKCYNFYDWFCKDSSLERKARSLFPKVKKFVETLKIDTESTYVFFKNNCPVANDLPLYDDFRICENSEDGKVLWTVTPRRERKGERTYGGRRIPSSYWCEIWGRINNFKEPYIEAPTFTEALKLLKEKLEE